MARRSRYNEVLQKAICDLLKMGATRTAAGNKNRICRDTFHEWMIKKPAFSDAVIEAEAAAELTFTATVLRAARGDPANDLKQDWRAAAFWLERRRREEFGNNITVQSDAAARELIAQLLAADAKSNPGDSAERDSGD